MALSRNDIRRIAELSRIDIDESEIDGYAGQLDKVLDFFNQLNAANTDGIEPMLSAAPDENVFRADVVSESLTPDSALKNAPARAGDCFGVPAVIE